MRTITQELSLRFKSMAFLCALMVVVIHSASNLGVPNEWIAVAVRDGVCRVAVPFFFFASGFFLVGHVDEKNWWRKAVVSRCSSLLIPYMVFNVAYWILRYVTMGNLGFSFHDIFCALGFSPTCHPVCQPLWYVRALFILVFCSPVVLWLMAVLDRTLFTGSFLFLVFLLYGWLGAYEGVGGGDNIFRKYFAIQGLFYMSCGIMFRSGKIDVILRGRWQQVAVLFVGVGLMAAKVFFHVQGNWWYVYLGWLSVPVLLIAVFNLLPTNLLPQTILACAFPIYLTHIFVLRAMSLGGKALGVSYDANCWIWIMAVMSCCGVTLGITYLLRRKAPCLNGVLWGNR